MSLTLTSSAFKHNGEIPTQYTCEGKDLSPPLAWSGVPAGSEKPRADRGRSRCTRSGRAEAHLGALGALQHSGDCVRVAGSREAIAAWDSRRTQRLAAHRIRRPVPTDRAPSLFPQALRARHCPSGSRQGQQGQGRGSHEGSYPRAGGVDRDIPEAEVSEDQPR